MIEFIECINTAWHKRCQTGHVSVSVTCEHQAPGLKILQQASAYCKHQTSNFLGHSVHVLGFELTFCITLLARSLLPPINVPRFYPTWFPPTVPIRCWFCLLQFAYYTLCPIPQLSALHEIYFIPVLSFISFIYTIWCLTAYPQHLLPSFSASHSLPL